MSLSASKLHAISPDHAIAISPLSLASCAHSQTPSKVRSGVRPQPSPPTHGISGANCPRYRKSLAPASPGCEPANILISHCDPVQITVCSANVTAECTHSIDPSSQDVEDALRDQPRQPHLALQLRNAKCLDAMENRKQRAQSHSNEHEGAKRSPSRRAETWEQHNHHGRCSNGRDLCSS